MAAADTDSLAERATRENAHLNGLLAGADAPGSCQGSLTVTRGSAEELAGLLGGHAADLLLCNILAPVIEALIPCFPSCWPPGAWVC